MIVLYPYIIPNFSNVSSMRRVKGHIIINILVTLDLFNEHCVVRHRDIHSVHYDQGEVQYIMI